MPEKSIPTDGEQSLENAQQATQQLVSGMPDTTPLDNPDDTATSSYEHAYKLLGRVEEAQRHRIATQMGQVVDLGVSPEAESSEIKPEKYQSKLTEECIKHIGTYFSGAYDPEKTEDEVWTKAIEMAIDGRYEMQPNVGSRGAALVMSVLSGVELNDWQKLTCLRGSRFYAGVAAWSEANSQYQPVSIDEPKFAQDLIGQGEAQVLVDELDRFRSLPASLAYELVDTYPAVVRNLASFEDPDYNLLAHKLLDSGNMPELFGSLDDFKNLDNDIVDAFLNTGSIADICAVAQNLSSFENPDYQKVADELTKGNNPINIGYVASFLPNFKSLNNETAQTLLTYYPHDTIANRGVFNDLTIEQIADAVIERHGQVIFDRIKDFSNEERGYLAQRIMNAGTAYAEKLIPQLEDFKDTTLDENALVDLFINYKPEVLLNNLDHFTSPDVERIVDAALEQKLFSQIAVNLPKLSNLKLDVAQTLIEQESSGIYVVMAQHADAFHSPAEVLSLMPEHIWTDSDFADAVVENIAKYNLTSDALNEVLTKCAQNYSTAQKIAHLDLHDLGLKQSAVDTLLAKIASIKPELTDVREDNPYESVSGSIDVLTLTKPGTELHKIGSQISKLLREAKDDSTHPFNSLATAISNKFGGLESQIVQRQKYNGYDDVLGEEPNSPTNSLFPTYRRLVADYLALEFEDRGYGLETVSKTELAQVLVTMSNVLSHANDKFLDVLQTDIPYYDKLYTEWDAKRLGQKDFQEVFLGRDGVYAYIGRRAQLQARKRFLGLEGQRHELEMPTYLVYPRTFRDSLNPETKSEYLSQNIPSPQAAHYYDTGFTGTIPQDIMRVLGVSEADWDERIRLLSASKRDRTVLGLEGSKSERDQVVNTVEYNVKNESTAQGLYGDGDVLKPYAQPTTAAERLAFGLVQQALHRHYYVREMHSLQSSETRIAMTAQTLQGGELRLSSELDEVQKKELTDLFDHDNIGQRLLATAQTIKLSDPNDPYPDEAVFEIPLSSTDGVIVKSVVTDKQQGPLDEFEALILLQKLGIDSPKPLGRIFTNGQHGFIVMQKLPGISGRAIQQYFDDNSIPEPEQIFLLARAKEKMIEVAETVRRDTGLDKPWRLKDFMVVFGRVDDGSGFLDVQRMLPIDFERANVFDPKRPQSIEIE